MTQSPSEFIGSMRDARDSAMNAGERTIEQTGESELQDKASAADILTLMGLPAAIGQVSSP